MLTKTPDTPIMGYRMMAPMGCANRAVGTMLAMRKPIDRMLQVLSSSAIMNENQQAHAYKTAGAQWGWCEFAAGHLTQPKENENRKNDRTECAKGLAQEDLDLDPSQFPESTQHHLSSLLPNRVTGQL